jgi:DNA-binding PadR family transcriptional regulator
MTAMTRNHNHYEHNHHDHQTGAARASARAHHDFPHRDRGFGRGFGPGFDGPFGAAFGPGFGGPGHGGRGWRRAGKGDIRSVILLLLADGPSNGYGLIKAIAEKTGGVWRPSPGSVYPTLQQLLDEELIVATGDGRRTEYALSDTGRQYVEQNSDDLGRAWDATPGRSQEQAAFFESAGKLMGVVGQFRFSATDEQRAAAVEKLDEARRALYLILAD